MFKLSLFFLFTYSLAVFGQSGESQSESEIELKIDIIQKKLTVLKNKLNSAYGQEQQIISRLEEQEKAISTVSNQVEISTQLLNDINKQLDFIQTDIINSTKSIEEQKDQIVELLKLQVYINHDKTLRMLLANQKSATNITTKHRIKYLQNKLYNLIKEVAEKIANLKVLKQEQLVLQEKESEHKIELTQQQDQLISQRKLRLVTLKQLKTEIAKHESESENLNKDQRRLQDLLDEIQVLLTDLPKDLGLNKPFKKLKGLMTFEIAQQLIAVNEKVAFFGVVDRFSPWSVNKLAYGGRFIRTAFEALINFRGHKITNYVSYRYRRYKAHLHKTFINDRQSVSTVTDERVTATDKKNTQGVKPKPAAEPGFDYLIAQDAYRASDYPSPITLFISEGYLQHYQYLARHMIVASWRNVLSRPKNLDVIIVPGDLDENIYAEPMARHLNLQLQKVSLSN